MADRTTWKIATPNEYWKYEDGERWGSCTTDDWDNVTISHQVGIFDTSLNPKDIVTLGKVEGDPGDTFTWKVTKVEGKYVTAERPNRWLGRPSYAEHQRKFPKSEPSDVSQYVRGRFPIGTFEVGDTVTLVKYRPSS